MRKKHSLSRSEQMARIKGWDTRPEVILRKTLWNSGLRYRIHCKGIAGRPDIVFPGKKLIVFMDGCQWHGCPDHYVRPRTNTQFWSSKLRENVERDRRQTNLLESDGWRVYRVWEHQIYEELAEIVAVIKNLLDDPELVPNSESWRILEITPVDAETDIERRRLEGLRDPNSVRFEEKPRSTKKWRKPRSGG